MIVIFNQNIDWATLEYAVAAMRHIWWALIDFKEKIAASNSSRALHNLIPSIQSSHRSNNFPEIFQWKTENYAYVNVILTNAVALSSWKYKKDVSADDVVRISEHRVEWGVRCGGFLLLLFFFFWLQTLSV